VVVCRNVFRSWVSRWASLFDNCVEAIVVISCIINCPNGTVRFKDTVGPFDLIAVSVLPLTLEVACMLIFDTVIELVSGISLRTNKLIKSAEKRNLFLDINVIFNFFRKIYAEDTWEGRRKPGPAQQHRQTRRSPGAARF
jgi:hypothetical protein